MILSDWIGFTGVTILLIAFSLNLLGRISVHSPLYSLLNFIGAGLACVASVMISYLPFIILEGAWTLVSLVTFIKVLKK
jgi:hypothetical protein